MQAVGAERLKLNVTVVIFILLLPLILPSYIQSLEVMENIITFINIIMFLILSFLTIIKKRFNLLLFIILSFLLWRSFSSFYLLEGVLDIKNSLNIINLIFLVNLLIKKYPKSTISALSILFGVYILINYLTLTLFPEGLYIENPRPNQYRIAWFLGSENQQNLILLPGLTLLMLSSWYNNKKITLFVWLQITIVILTAIKIGSVTTIVSLLFLILLSLISIKVNVRILQKYTFYLLSYIIIWLVLVRFNSIDSFQAIIVDVLQKDLTLSGRTRIWAVVFEAISLSPLIGYGINTTLLSGKVTYFNAHNMILQSVLDSGYIALLLLIIAIVIAGVKLQKGKKNKKVTILMIGIFSILVGGLTESYAFNYLFLFLIIAFNIDYLLKIPNKQS